MSGDHTALRSAIHRKTGVNLEEDKLYLVEARLSDLMREHSIGSYEEMAKRFEEAADSPFFHQVIDRITTHETRFFRDESIFDAMIVQILPEWFEKRGITRAAPGGARLDIWSAACSTGQEVYSIAMLLSEKFPELVKGTRILGTDISQPTLERARAGIYSAFEMDRGLQERFQAKYFSRSGEGMQVCQQLRAMTEFRALNLIADAYPSGFDIIFCRNVCIYFTEEEKRRVFSRLAAALKPDGVLILGSAESLNGYYANYVMRECGLARYYEINNSTVTMFKQK